MHADLDAFYASVEVLREPKLKGKPVIVGGTSSRGVVTSASYEARKYGIHSAMPTSRARRLCPNAIFIQPDFEMYAVKSKEVRRVFDSFSPVVEPLSLDEAFLDVSGASKMWAGPEEMAKGLRDDVLGQTGLSVSVGIAPNKFLAKLASKHSKPDGMVLIHPDEVDEFLRPLPVEALWGVGTETASILKRFGLRTIGDVVNLPQSSLERALGSLGGHIARLARGIDDRGVVADSPRKSMGAEETFERDLTDTGEILRVLLKLSDRVASRLRARGISGQTVTLKVRFSNFTTITRSVTLPAEVDGARSIYLVVRDLISRVLSGGGASGHPRIRLLGVSLSNLKDWPPSEQLSFDPAAGWSDADRTLDLVRRRFGEEAIEFGVLLESSD
ncbi:MAG: DNA polymerase IV [Actinobacteria bacterium]|nr:DNA polymerase IV [Actinomycetota bacterium]